MIDQIEAQASRLDCSQSAVVQAGFALAREKIAADQRAIPPCLDRGCSTNMAIVPTRAISLASLLLLQSATVAADADPPVKPTTRTVHYRTTIGIIDAIALGLFGGGAVIADRTDGVPRGLAIGAIALGASAFVLVPPGIHTTRCVAPQNECYSNLLSGALRIGLPAIAIGVGVKLSECPEDDKQCDKRIRTVFIGAGVAAVAASVLDIALLAKVEVVVPHVGVTSGGGTIVGVAGSF